MVAPTAANISPAAPSPRPAVPRPEPVLRQAPVTAVTDVDEDEEDDDLLDAESASASGVPGADLPEDDEVEEPQYRGAGRWTELPLPGAAPRRTDVTEDEEPEPSPSVAVDRGTSVRMAGLSEPLQRIMELARGEAYWVYLGGVVVVIVILLGLLLALR